jgi:hypothetical protein
MNVKPLVEKLIAQWQEKNPNQVNRCNSRHEHYCVCDCPACTLDALLADKEQADDKLIKAIFEIMAEIEK